MQKKYGKPNGIRLSTHTESVHRFGSEARVTWPFLAIKYRDLTGLDLIERCELAEQYHDYGKGRRPWQEPCKRDVDLYRKWLIEHGLPYDPGDYKTRALYERDCFKQNKSAAPNLKCAKYRHEFASCKYLQDTMPDFPHESYCAIAAHHGKLSLSPHVERRWQEDGLTDPLQSNGPFYKLYQRIAREHNTYQHAPYRENVLRRFQYAAVRTLLRLADTRASRWEGMGDDGMVALIPFKRSRGYGPGSELRPVQQLAIHAAGEERTILRAPTGSGKTYASLLWAEQQILGERPKADRLIVAMPTRFTSNAILKEIEEQYLPLEFREQPISSPSRREASPVSLYHSSAFYSLYGSQDDYTRSSQSVERHKLSKQLAFPITVCTIDHLLACLTGQKEDHYATFYFLANSCVVFDETDFYDPFIQANMVRLLKTLRILKVPTLIMSATVPNSARELYGVTSPIREVAQPGSGRVTKNMFFLGQSVTPADCANVIEQMIQAGEGIIYANTVRRALDYYQYLRDQDTEVPIILYHSRFTESDKRNIETSLLQTLGKTAHRKGQARGIAILTQIGEMSINISSNLMLSDCCPWDRLAQRVGRLARFATEATDPVQARLYITEPVTETGEAYAWPYVIPEENKLKTFQPGRPYLQTLTQIAASANNAQPFRLTPEILVSLTNDLYPSVETITGAAQANQLEYESLIKGTWLMAGSNHMSVDEGSVGASWKAREIADQVSVLTIKPDGLKVRSQSALYDFFLEHGVNCPSYKIEAELRKGEADGGPAISTLSIRVGREDDGKDMQVYYALPGAYRRDVGLASVYGYPWLADQTL
ncbi:CRISPR-associated helicase Cas3' [Neolewinella marina]|uniref:CRISPR-associated helicase Cas3' n=1 Tax=Neolewinella marina TaxID=438751 RepID=UPI001ADDAFB5|nr:CRISPR-associated helicase Cas3' [Neolewinella marina]